MCHGTTNLSIFRISALQFLATDLLTCAPTQNSDKVKQTNIIGHAIKFIRLFLGIDVNYNSYLVLKVLSPFSISWNGGEVVCSFIVVLVNCMK